MGLRDDILTKPREASGAASANRFDFQKDWALCRLFEIHSGNRDYVLILEHHEDVMVCLFDAGAESAECYQIKTRALNLRKWGLTELLHRKQLQKETALSILGKMYDNCRVLGSAVASVNFVTNSPYLMTLKGGVACDGRDKFCLNELEQTEIDKIHKQMVAEHTLPASPNFVPLAHLHQTDLSLHDHATHATGRCADFLERLTPGRPYPVKTVYRTLFDEIRRRANYEWNATTWDDIIKHKAVTRAEFQAILDSIPETRQFDVVWGTIQPMLTAEGESLTSILALRRECRTVELDRMDSTKTVAAQLRRESAGIAVSVAADTAWPTMRGKLEAGVAAIRRRKVPGDHVYSDQYLKAMLLLAIYEY